MPRLVRGGARPPHPGSEPLRPFNRASRGAGIVVELIVTEPARRSCSSGSMLARGDCTCGPKCHSAAAAYEGRTHRFVTRPHAGRPTFVEAVRPTRPNQGGCRLHLPAHLAKDVLRRHSSTSSAAASWVDGRTRTTTDLVLDTIEHASWARGDARATQAGGHLPTSVEPLEDWSCARRRHLRRPCFSRRCHTHGVDNPSVSDDRNSNKTRLDRFHLRWAARRSGSLSQLLARGALTLADVDLRRDHSGTYESLADAELPGYERGGSRDAGALAVRPKRRSYECSVKLDTTAERFLRLTWSTYAADLRFGSLGWPAGASRR